MEPSVQEWIEKNYGALYKRLTRFGYHLTGDMAQAEDTAQDVFTLVLLHPERLENCSNRVGWLMSAMHKMIANERRRMRNEELPLEEELIPHPDWETGSLEELLPKELREQDRTLLLWRFEWEMSYREIANRLGISEGACRARMLRARSRCKALLEKAMGNKKEKSKKFEKE